MDKVLTFFTALYGQQVGKTAYQRATQMMEDYRWRIPQPAREGLDQSDAILITYADHIQQLEQAPLETLAEFCSQHLSNVVSSVHMLPFYPWSSDDGFAVSDYRQVSPDYGDWGHLHRLGQNFRLMFDAVLNHASTHSQWFQSFLQGEPRYADYFITVEGDPDLTDVVRPRALPLLTRFQTAAGEKAVWTTFSADQVDLNYQNPDVLLEMLDVLLFYVSKGAEFIRLDAVAYLWKEIGTTCIHLPQTHTVVQLLRAVLDEVAPYVMLITETNVPHKENVSYFGDGTNEAHLVYNFALPPLVLYTLQSGSCEALAQWAVDLRLPSRQVTFFNFLASHDGIGLNPARGILTEAQIDSMIQQVQMHGGLVSFKNNPDGSQSPYELNVNYFDALSNPHGNESRDLQVGRFIAAHAILLSLAGLPGIYFHSLFGSRGWPEGVQQAGHKRAINRQKLKLLEVEAELSDLQSLRSQVFRRLQGLLSLRMSQPAFHPFGDQRVLECGQGVFGLLRFSPDGTQMVFCLINVTDQLQTVIISGRSWSRAYPNNWQDLVDGKKISLANLSLSPYQVMWLIPSLQNNGVIHGSIEKFPGKSPARIRLHTLQQHRRRFS